MMDDCLFKAKKLRIYLGETDPFEEIVLTAKKHGLAGATVFRGRMGYGPHKNAIRTSSIAALSCDLPIVVEIIDTEAKINAVFPYLKPLINKGMVTLESVAVVYYGQIDD